MTVLVDEVREYAQPPKRGLADRFFGNGKRSCHMATDSGDPEELHAMAARIGLKRAWYQNSSIPHYDLTPSKRALAVEAGAREVSSLELVRAVMKAQGRVRRSE